MATLVSHTFSRSSHMAWAAALLLAVLLAAACVMPAQAPPPAPVDDVARETVDEIPTTTVNTDANVREGPGTDHSAIYWLVLGTVVNVTGRNADGSWLQIEHDGRAGWIFRTLTDIEPSVSAGLPEVAPASGAADAGLGANEGASEGASDAPGNGGNVGAPAEQPAPVPTPEPVVEPEPTPPTVETEPTPDPETIHAIVIGTVVNLRLGPGTNYGIDGQVRAGDRLHLTGRNADGSWLRVMHPVATGEHVWIFAALTDIASDAVQTLSVAADVVVEIEPAPTPEPVAEPTPPSGDVPPAVQSAIPTVPSDCTRLHTVNPNESQLSQITDWFGLDLNTIATLNGIGANAPLVAGSQICLAAGSGAPSPTTGTQAPPSPAPVVQPGQPGAVVKYETGDCRTHGGHVYECRFLANWPEHAVTELTGVPTKYHAPGMYDRSEHPGLAYEWELKFSDDSHLWDWAVRDFEGCYDALRVQYGEVPEAVGLKSLEFRLSDSKEGSGEGDRTGMGLSSSYSFPDTFWDWTFPDRPRGTWQPSDLPHPDMAITAIRCFAPRGQPEDEVFCRIQPGWGNEGSIHLEWTVVRAMSLAAEQMSRRVITRQYNWQHPIIVDLAAYLTPIIDDRSGHPAGYGACMQLARVR